MVFDLLEIFTLNEYFSRGDKLMSINYQYSSVAFKLLFLNLYLPALLSLSFDNLIKIFFADLTTLCVYSLLTLSYGAILEGEHFDIKYESRMSLSTSDIVFSYKFIKSRRKKPF